MTASLPVGVFDSGVGGLSILEKIHTRFPTESLLYVADSAHAPYGPKGEAFIIERSRQILGFFHAQPVKAVVVACNTATAAAVKQLRAEYAVPIIGMEPAVKPAAGATRSGVVGVLATEGTLASDKFVDLKSRFENQVEIITVPCPGLVEQIERLLPDNALIDDLLRQFITPLLAKQADTIVLGCTHYTFIADRIRAIAGSEVAIVDTDDAVARRLGSVLGEMGLLQGGDGAGEVKFYTSGEPDVQQRLISTCWGNPVEVLALPGL